MKKWICAAMALVLAVSMAACAGNDPQNETVKPTEKPSATEATKPSTDAPKPTDPTTNDGKFENKVLLDNDQISFTISGVQTDPTLGYSILLQVENKTGKDLKFSLEEVSVNGSRLEVSWAETIPAGQKINSKISFPEKSFTDNRIETVKSIEFTLRVFNEKDPAEEDTHKEHFTVNMQ